MTALPSFEDLMASLGLDADSGRARSSSITRPRSATLSPNPNGGGLRISRHGAGQSKSISSLRDLDIQSEANDQLPTPPESARIRSRYSPYGGEETRKPVGKRASHTSTSSERTGSSSPPSNKFQRRLLPRLEQVPDDLAKLVPDLPADAPISMYARRNTPQASPISPSYARPGHHPFHDFSDRSAIRRQKSTSPPLQSAGMPIALPTVPILLSQPSPRASSPRLNHRVSYSSFQREHSRNVTPVA